MRRIVSPVPAIGLLLLSKSYQQQHQNSMSLSSTISKSKEIKELIEPKPRQQTRRQADGEEQRQRKEDSDKMLRMESTDDSPMQHSCAAATLPSLDDENESEKDDELPNLMQFFLRNKIVEHNSSLLHRFQRQDGTMITTRTSNHLRSDVSAITLDTALEPIDIQTTEVPLLKDMTTFFSSLPNPSNDALRMRRASLSAAEPTNSFPQEKYTLKQPRRASVAGGEPYLDSSLSNARQPRRMIEYPPETPINKKNTQGLIMPQRRSSSPKPPAKTTSDSPQANTTSTLLPFVSSPPNRHRPDPQALTPTDRDPHPLATFLINQKKLEPTGRAATGGRSTRFPEASPSTPTDGVISNAPTSPTHSQKSLQLPPLPVSSPSSASKQSLSSLEKAGDSTRKRSRAFRQKSPTKTKHEPTNPQDLQSSRRPEETMPAREDDANSPNIRIPKRRSIPSPRRIRQAENKVITNSLDASVSQPKTMNEPLIKKKQASPRKVRLADTKRSSSQPVSNEQHMDVLSSAIDKPNSQTTLSPKQVIDGLPSPRKKQPRNGLMQIPMISFPESGVEPEDNASPFRGVSRKVYGEGMNRSGAARDQYPRKTQTIPHESEPTLSTSKRIDVTETSPGSVKRRIRSSPGKRRCRSASMNHVSIMTSSTVIHDRTAISTEAEHMPSGCKDDEQLNEQTVSERSSIPHGTSRNQSPSRCSRSIRFLTTDSSKMAKEEKGRRTSPFRRKQRASSIGHVPFSKKGERQIEASSSGGSPRTSNSKANRGDGVSVALPNKALPSPRRRRRRVASMQHVPATILYGDDVKFFENNGNNLSVSRVRRAMSMQHVSILEGDDENDREHQNSAKALMGTKPFEPLTERLSEPRNLTLRHSLSSEFMSTNGYDSAPESQGTPLSHGEARAKYELEHTKSRFSGFNPDLVIKDLTSFANAGDCKYDRSNPSGAKPNDFFGVAVGLFRRGEKKPALNQYDESSVNYAKTGSLLQERYRPATS
ncbi:hypothetical protein FisN_14Lh022 [Fistulifera solaris]|uniref:Uncharacterized protein n=1 Tax=Fistulifera solaris TaxID=1519565 RepID=A0A1Z5KHC3_FISSO|nr:hypothetical protein FisN_14Lh022 [Fistulifera solaris]|eukprot:GAX25713.1 hypothetical protein FisN_14Lh022 [Fistulifera solaris]